MPRRPQGILFFPLPPLLRAVCLHSCFLALVRCVAFTLPPFLCHRLSRPAFRLLATFLQQTKPEALAGLAQRRQVRAPLLTRKEWPVWVHQGEAQAFDEFRHHALLAMEDALCLQNEVGERGARPRDGVRQLLGHSLALQHGRELSAQAALGRRCDCRMQRCWHKQRLRVF